MNQENRVKKRIDLTGQKFGKLLVLSYVGIGTSQWICKCDCGNTISIKGHSLTAGDTKSCGCIMKEKNELIGKNFGRLIVIEISDPYVSSDGKIVVNQWICKCECGNMITIRQDNLKSGNSQSCGCLAKEVQEELTKNRRLKRGEASFNRAFYVYKHGADVRNIPFELSKELFKKIVEQNCHYCGIEPKQSNKKDGFYGDYIHNGIDRVDPNKGYTNDNTVPCCMVCNYAKRKMLPEEFLSWIEKVYNHSIVSRKENENGI